MDNRSIFSKTGKGSLEISKKTIKLSSEERQALILVDGKTNFGELQEKLSRVSPPKLRAVFEKLVELELIREFVAKDDPPAAPPPVGAISVRELGGGSDLDFTALAPAPLVDPAKELEARRKAAAEAEEEARQVREAILRKEQERKIAEDATKRAAEEEARRAAEVEARRKAEAERLAREQREREERERLERERQERERLEREEAARRAAEEEARRKAEAERLAREQREREERERLEKERQERERLEREEAMRRAAEEEARRKAEAERLAREQREREERERLEKERQERERLEREEAMRRAAEEEARRKAEAERLAREQREREARERLERERQEKEQQEREAAARRAEEDARRKAAAEQHAREEQELEARHKAERDKLERDRLARQREEAESEAAAQLAARSTTAAAAISLTQPASPDFNAEIKPADSADLDFAPAAPEQRRKSEVEQLLSSNDTAGLDGATPLAGGGPDTFADTGSVMDPFADDDTKSSKEKEVASRKEIELEAKERAKAEARAKKEAEREARRLAKESRVKVRGNGPSVGTIVAGLVLVSILGAIGYLIMMPIDKAAIERALSERLGEPATVGSAKFSAFPPELTLGAVVVGSIKLNNIVARPDSTSLMSDHKIWKTVEVNGLSTNVDGARAVLALGTREVSKIAAGRTEIQRVRINDVEVTGLAVVIPKFGVDVSLNSAGTIKQVSLSTPDEKARVSLQPDGDKWLVDMESRGMAWPIGPKIAWESVRGKGLAHAGGIKFEEYSVTHFGGSSRGAGELSWAGNWKFSGNLDLGNLESEAMSQAYYGAAPISGSVEGKLSISMSAPALSRLFDAPQIDGAISVNKAVVKNVDLARTAQTGGAASGSTRFTDFSATVAAAGGKLQLKDIKGVSGLLTVSGTADVNADKALGGNLTVELGVGGSRAKANVRLSGSLAEPKISK